MHEDETRIAGGDAGGDPSGPPQGWSNGGQWNSGAPYGSSDPYRRAPHCGATPPPEPKRRGLGWVGPLIVILAAVVAFALVLFFTKGRHSTPASPTPSNSVAGQAPSQGGSASPAPASSGSSPDSTAPLPGGSTSCLQDGTQQLSAPDAVSIGTPMSCDFGNEVISAVRAHVQSDPDTTSFSLDDQYSASADQYYDFTCGRQNHLTTCTAQGNYGQIGVAVQDH